MREIKEEDPDYKPIAIPESYKDTEDLRLTSNADKLEKN